MDAAFLLSKPVLFRTNEYLSSPTFHSPLSTLHSPLSTLHSPQKKRDCLFDNLYIFVTPSGFKPETF